MNLASKSIQLNTLTYSPTNENSSGLVFVKLIPLLTPKLNSFVSITSACFSIYSNSPIKILESVFALFKIDSSSHLSADKTSLFNTLAFELSRIIFFLSLNGFVPNSLLCPVIVKFPSVCRYLSYTLP